MVAPPSACLRTGPTMPASPRACTGGRATRGGQGHLVPGERVLSQSEVIRAILLENSPCCGVSRTRKSTSPIGVPTELGCPNSRFSPSCPPPVHTPNHIVRSHCAIALCNRIVQSHCAISCQNNDRMTSLKHRPHPKCTGAAGGQARALPTRAVCELCASCVRPSLPLSKALSKALCPPAFPWSHTASMASAVSAMASAQPSESFASAASCGRVDRG